MTVELFVAGVTFGITTFKTIINQRKEYLKNKGAIKMWGFVIGAVIGLGVCIVVEIMVSNKAILV